MKTVIKLIAYIGATAIGARIIVHTVNGIYDGAIEQIKENETKKNKG